MLCLRIDIHGLDENRRSVMSIGGMSKSDALVAEAETDRSAAEEVSPSDVCSGSRLTTR